MKEFILTIDSGNTATKVVLFKKNKELLQHFKMEDLEQVINSYQLSEENTDAILVSVSNKIITIPFPLIDIKDYFQKNIFLNMPVHYSQTLGLDRLAVSYWAYLIKQKPSIIIDAGTFTTFDLIDENGFQGGYILPGLNLLAETYNRGSNLFSPTDLKAKVERKIPQDTETAILNGVYYSFLTPILQLISENQDQDIIITGGNGDTLTYSLKSANLQQDASIQLEPDLIHNALLEIYIKVKC